jgi:hypothetical protein
MKKVLEAVKRRKEDILDLITPDAEQLSKLVDMVKEKLAKRETLPDSDTDANANPALSSGLPNRHSRWILVRVAILLLCGGGWVLVRP